MRVVHNLSDQRAQGRARVSLSVQRQRGHGYPVLKDFRAMNGMDPKK